MKKTKLIRTATVAISLDILLKGQLQFLNESYDVIAVSGDDEHLQTVKNREGVAVKDVAIKRNISPLNDLVSLYKLYRYFKKEKPLIVHSITPKAGLLSMTAAYFAKVPLRVHTFTGLVFPTKTGLMQKILILMDKILCNFATAIYPEGEGVKKDLINYKITNKKLNVIANGNVNGIDVEHFNAELISEETKAELKNKLKILPDDFVFLFIGRLVTDKGINEAIQAFKVFSAEKDVKLLLVGPFEDADPLLPETLLEIKTNEKIISTGFQQDVRPYLAISDVLVFPSYREGFPNVVLQAGAMNLPSIVTDINGSREIIIEGENGIIIPVRNSEVLLEAMKKMFDDKVFREKLQKNSRDLIVRRYEQSKVWEAILKEYQRLETIEK